MSDPTNLREQLKHCLGGHWPDMGGGDPRDLQSQTHNTNQYDGYRIESVSYATDSDQRVPALLLIPDGVDGDHPAPAVAVWHQHAGRWDLGKSEPAGLGGDPMHHTGAALAKEGYVVLCPDALCFEDRQSDRMPGREYEEFQFLQYLVDGKCLAWKNILDMTQAISYLCCRPEVQASAIGCYGNSMGSTFTWLIGPWDPRIRCLVGNCCLPTYAAIRHHHLLHCFSNFIPGFHQYGDTPDIAGLIAPRPLLLNFGELDELSPIEEVRLGIKKIEGAYAQAGAADKFASYVEPGVGHVFSSEMWHRTRDWFAVHLKS
jgi:dienelactone hydrolase